MKTASPQVQSELAEKCCQLEKEISDIQNEDEFKNSRISALNKNNANQQNQNQNANQMNPNLLPGHMQTQLNHPNSHPGFQGQGQVQGQGPQGQGQGQGFGSSGPVNQGQFEFGFAPNPQFDMLMRRSDFVIVKVNVYLGVKPTFVWHFHMK
eukprot:CAMPEP_0116988388 /NCGR_PEP_ID=MMETSP0467-20121206/64124_1 /TAXON_ID=283647 /ORGANISM="Mesodinium pulex, Strain SPMC105" /LENGTH=151 /DNA_ID=CAMNT_0004684493 /DNA_START=281 /DNA_END=736 /DNA_ORIENTATION=-